MTLCDQTIPSSRMARGSYTDKATFVFILGMHRSGTSCLAGALERCGLFLGDVSRSNISNPKGTHELSEVRRAHGQILRDNRGNWRHPPDRVVVSPRHGKVLQRIAERFKGLEPCGIKDPRLLLLLEHWLDAFDSYTLVGTYRHPVAVTMSLDARAPERPFQPDRAYQLWLRYNTELVRWHRVHNFPIIEFDLRDIETYVRTVATLAIDMGLEPDMDKLREFVTPALDHYRGLEAPIPEVCQEVWAYLREHRYQPDISNGVFASRLRVQVRSEDVHQVASHRSKWKPLRLLRLQSRLPGAVRPLLRPLVRMFRRLTGL